MELAGVVHRQSKMPLVPDYLCHTWHSKDERKQPCILLLLPVCMSTYQRYNHLVSIQKISLVSFQVRAHKFPNMRHRSPRLWEYTTPEAGRAMRSEEHTSELQSRPHLLCRLLLLKK